MSSTTTNVLSSALASPTQRQKILSLYRRILKLGNEWSDSQYCKTKVNSFHKTVYYKQFITYEQDANDFTKGDEEIQREQDYIIDQAKTQFRANKNTLHNSDEIDSKIELAEKRLELTLHYGIPFERPEHVNIYDNFWKGEIDSSLSSDIIENELNDDKIHSMKGLNPNYDELEPKFPSTTNTNNNSIKSSLELSEDENWK